MGVEAVQVDLQTAKDMDGGGLWQPTALDGPGIHSHGHAGPASQRQHWVPHAGVLPSGTVRTLYLIKQRRFSIISAAHMPFPDF